MPAGTQHRPVRSQQPATRERIVAAARELFLERGFQATSLHDIAQQAGANPGSVYYCFRTKEDILGAVLDWYLDNLGPEILAPAWAACSDPLERIFAILEGYRQMLLVSEFTAGCPIGNLAIEVGPHLESARSKIVANFESWKAAVRECLDAVPGDVDRDAVASLVLTTMEGAVLQARAYRSIEPYEASVRALRDYLQRVAAAAAPRRR